MYVFAWTITRPTKYSEMIALFLFLSSFIFRLYHMLCYFIYFVIINMYKNYYYCYFYNHHLHYYYYYYYYFIYWLFCSRFYRRLILRPFLAVGHIATAFQKSQMPGRLPGADVEASIWPMHNVSYFKQIPWLSAWTRHFSLRFSVHWFTDYWSQQWLKTSPEVNW